MRIKYISEWHWTIDCRTLLVGKTYGSNGKPDTYQYHLHDARNESGHAFCGFIQEFDLPSANDAYRAGVKRYKELFLISAK